jgi:hypothetical protein
VGLQACEYTSLDELGITLLAVVLAAFGSSVIVRLVLDDTLTHRTGKKVSLATSHADPVLKQSNGRPFISYGHVFVVLSIHVSVPRISSTGWALPFLFRLFEGSKQGGKLDSPSDRLQRARPPPGGEAGNGDEAGSETRR